MRVLVCLFFVAWFGVLFFIGCTAAQLAHADAAAASTTQAVGFLAPTLGPLLPAWLQVGGGTVGVLAWGWMALRRQKVVR